MTGSINIREFLEGHGLLNNQPKPPEKKALTIIKASKDGISFGLLRNRFRGKSASFVADAVQVLVDGGLVSCTEKFHPVTGRATMVFRATQKETT